MTHARSATRFATRQNARIAYDPGSSPTGAAVPVVLLLHDLLADRSVWAGVRDRLVVDHRVVIPDARGHGASPTLANRWYTVGELAADDLAILDAEDIAAAHLVGHGLGAATAFELARRRHARVRSLALIAPALGSILDNDPAPAVRAARAERRTGDRAAADAAYKGRIDDALDRYLVPRHGAAWRDELPPPRLAAIRRHAPALAALLPALDAYAVDRDAARVVDQPVLIVVAADAALIERTVGDRLGSLLPSCRLAGLPAGSRPVPGDGANADTLASMLAGFFAAATDPSPR